MAIKAAVVDPVGLWANWSSNLSEVRAGSKYLLTMGRAYYGITSSKLQVIG